MPELPQVAHPKSQVPYVVIAVVAALAIGYLQWSLVNQTASRVVVPATALSIGLAWYSILSLRETRGENRWHTGDRLLRATFVAVTLVFVVEIATKPAPAVGTTVVYEKVEVNLASELNAIAKTWSSDSVTTVIERHFSKLGRSERCTLRLPGSDHSVTFEPSGGSVKILDVR